MEEAFQAALAGARAGGERAALPSPPPLAAPRRPRALERKKRERPKFPVATRPSAPWPNAPARVWPRRAARLPSRS
eukprot:6269779-Alexandrium_andersonii.AAC.1